MNKESKYLVAYNNVELVAGEDLEEGDIVTIKDGKYYKIDPIEIETTHVESPFWKYAVPTFLVLAIIYFIIRAF